MRIVHLYDFVQYCKFIESAKPSCGLPVPFAFADLKPLNKLTLTIDVECCTKVRFSTPVVLAPSAERERPFNDGDYTYIAFSMNRAKANLDVTKFLEEIHASNTSIPEKTKEQKFECIYGDARIRYDIHVGVTVAFDTKSVISVLMKPYAEQLKKLDIEVLWGRFIS